MTTLVAPVRARLRGASFLSVLERIINRGSSAIVSLVMVFFVTPKEVGLYAGAMLVLTAVQMVGEIAIRQSAAALWRLRGGAQVIRRLSVWAAAATGLAVLGHAVFAWA